MKLLSLVFKIDYAMLVVVFGFGLALSLWMVFDHSWPEWDAAEHIHLAAKYAYLFHHPHLSSIVWWNEGLSVSQLYAPGVYVFNGLLKLVLGGGHWVDCFSLVLFQVIFSLSIWALTKQLANDRAAATLAVIFVNSYPFVIDITHRSLLELPVMAAIALTLALLVWWQDNPTITRTVLLGLMFGFACLVKQVCAFYLLGPFLYMFVKLSFMGKWMNCMKLISAGCLALLVMLPWYLSHYDQMRSFAHEYEGYVAGYSVDPWHVFSGYVAALPHLMSVPLLLLFIAAFLAKMRESIRLFALPAVAVVSGLCITSLISFHTPDPRYILPILCYTAIVTGYSIAQLLNSSHRLLRIIAISVVTLVLLFYFSLSFTPYPIPIANALASTESVSVGLFNPTPPGDIWGQEWIIETINKGTGGKPVWLCLLPNTRELNVHTLESVTRALDSNVRVTTVRKYVHLGDSVACSPIELQYYDWFLLKNEQQGINITNKSGAQDLAALENYIRGSGSCKLFAERKVADGSTISLYVRCKKNGESGFVTGN
jgi:4-amino-4-deoxy-L-arabinose transferase-like glycosyltransferase